MGSELASRILYCDTGCVVVNKAAGEAAEGAGKGMADLPRLLAAELARQEPALPDDETLPLPAAVHRLDVPVSGCTVFARTKTALQFLSEIFKTGGVKKLYWAIVEKPQNNGVSFSADSPAEKKELVHWIEFDSRRNKSIAHDGPGPGRKKAVLRYSMAGEGENYLFLEIELVTGRHHQIRAQFERIGLHVKGDLKYGARRSEKNGGIRLHARSLSFPNPSGRGGTVTVRADPVLQDNLWKAFQSAAETVHKPAD